MIKKLIAIFTLTSLYSCRLVAQQANAGKELFYLLDTSKVPKPDRMWTVSEDLPLIYYTLQCKCLHNGDNPVIGINTRKPIGSISAGQLHKLKLLTLPELIIRFRSADDNQELNDNIYVLVPQKQQYTLFKTKLLRKIIVN